MILCPANLVNSILWMMVSQAFLRSWSRLTLILFSSLLVYQVSVTFNNGIIVECSLRYDIPNDLRNLESTHLFKQAMKTYLLGQWSRIDVEINNL